MLPIPIRVCSIFRVSKQWYGCQCLKFVMCTQMLMHAIVQASVPLSVSHFSCKTGACGFTILYKQTSSVQCKMVSMHSEKPIAFLPISQKFPPALPLKQVQCLFLPILSRTIIHHFLFLWAISGLLPLALCPQVVVSQAPQHLRSET